MGEERDLEIMNGMEGICSVGLRERNLLLRLAQRSKFLGSDFGRKEGNCLVDACHCDRY